MRKYFLLSAVALMAATTANAETNYAEVTASAEVELASSFSCGDLHFGKLVIKKINEESYITFDGPDGYYSYGDILSDGADTGFNSGCSEIDNYDTANITIPDVELTADGVDTKLTLSELNVGEYDEERGHHYISGKLNIPANVKAGYYSNSFTIMSTI